MAQYDEYDNIMAIKWDSVGKVENKNSPLSYFYTPVIYFPYTALSNNANVFFDNGLYSLNLIGSAMLGATFNLVTYVRLP